MKCSIEGGRVRERYGNAEAGDSAFQCSHGRFGGCAGGGC